MRHQGCSGAPAIRLHCGTDEAPLQHRAPRASGERCDAAPGATPRGCCIGARGAAGELSIAAPPPATCSTSIADELHRCTSPPTRLHRSTAPWMSCRVAAQAPVVELLRYTDGSRRAPHRFAAQPTSGRLPPPCCVAGVRRASHRGVAASHRWRGGMQQVVGVVAPRGRCSLGGWPASPWECGFGRQLGAWGSSPWRRSLGSSV